LLAAFATVGCDVDVKDKGKTPRVNVDVESGRLPDVDVRGPDVDVATKEKEITVPDVDVSVESKKTTVTVPDIKVDIPQENEKTIDASSDADEK
jgi:hypothetical protein